jgi:hypothetical protein
LEHQSPLCIQLVEQLGELSAVQAVQECSFQDPQGQLYLEDWAASLAQVEAHQVTEEFKVFNLDTLVF